MYITKFLLGQFLASAIKIIILKNLQNSVKGSTNCDTFWDLCILELKLHFWETLSTLVKLPKKNTLQKQLESTVQLSRTRKCHLVLEKEPLFSSLKMFSHSVSCPYHVFASWQKTWLFIDQQYPTVYTRRNTDLKFKATKWLTFEMYANIYAILQLDVIHQYHLPIPTPFLRCFVILMSCLIQLLFVKTWKSLCV